jgi:hypothetical protein
VIDINKKAKPQERVKHVRSYSSASWCQVQDLYPIVIGTLDNPSGEGLILSALHQYLCSAIVCYQTRSIVEGGEARNIHFIAPIIITVASFFNGDIEILTEEDIDANRVHFYGHFEFVIKRGDKRICIVEAKKDDILQAKTLCLLGCDAICDVDNLPVCYGIATNFIHWCFLKNTNDLTTEENMTIQLGGVEIINSRSLKAVADKIIAILE